MKTKFLKNLKQFMFLLIAVLGTSSCYSQPTSNTSISGNIKPDTGVSCDPGGGKSSDGGLQQIAKTSSISLIEIKACILAYTDEICGQGGAYTGTDSDTGQIVINDDSAALVIGGGRGTNVGTGQYGIGVKSTHPDKRGKVAIGEFVHYNIGGNENSGGLCERDSIYTIGVKGNFSTNTGPISIFEIGAGKSCCGGMGKSIFIVPFAFEIGGIHASTDLLKPAIGGKGTTIPPGQIDSSILHC